ncbi:FUSC family protein [Yinghuangia seranimata]|uniref:FUSC family protein n=1 Tax=Yinghuangia seranimata TaxID=408067 RepID=UPI00248D2619|nr:FUSC family protein [Yinghuangia seranimata]MDI2127752.1 FUSC family protein [Yinghuangia seranimata]
MAERGTPPATGPALDRRAVVRRALRITLAASFGFYLCRYALDQPVMAVYALFGAVALGALSQIPGSGIQRAAAIAVALPIGLGLVAVGTAFAVATATAVAGMAVVGFCLAFAAVAGPRPAGAAQGLQLLYILPSFPPYAPGELVPRLIGAGLGMGALAAAEALVWPEPRAAPYRRVLADAVDAAGRLAARLAEAAPGGPAYAAVEPSAYGERLRPSRLPPAERPAGAGRTDRALNQAGSATRQLLAQLQALSGRPAVAADPASAALLGRVADACRDSSRALSGGPAPPATRMDEAIRDFQAVRLAEARERPESLPSLATLRRQSEVLAASVPALILKSAVRVGIDGRTASPLHPESLFWYVRRPTAALYWHRVSGHLTPRSVHFQNAVRITVGLSVARLAADVLDLAHGFWVLLAVLTLTRTNVMGTWRSVRSALVGTFAGALAAAGLLFGFGTQTDAYAAMLAPAMFVTFSVGPMLGIAWAQGLFTLIVASAFAQLAPSDWHLAQSRMLDVAAGCVIGLACGLLAWPRGAGSEVRRAIAHLMRTLGPTIDEATATLVTSAGAGSPGRDAVPSPVPSPAPSPAPPHAPSSAPSPVPVPEPPPDQWVPPAVAAARHALYLADSSFAQYQSEQGGSLAGRVDWQAALIAAHHALLGAQELVVGHDRPPSPLDPAAVARARSLAAALARTCGRLADDMAAGDVPPAAAPAPARLMPVSDGRGAVRADGRSLPLLVDLEAWLDSVARDLGHVRPKEQRR